MSGTRFYGLVRFSLIIIILVGTVLGVIAVSNSQSEHQAAASSMAYAQNLRDLQGETEQAQANALASLIDPTSDNATTQWDTYQESFIVINTLILTAATNAPDPTSLSDTTIALSNWQISVAIARHEALSDTGLGYGARLNLTNHYTALKENLALHVLVFHPNGSPMMILASTMSGLAGAAFVLALVLTARRSHRVINLGLTLGLAFTIGGTVVIAGYGDQDLWPTIVIALTGLGAIVATLAGIHTRTKEYS